MTPGAMAAPTKPSEPGDVVAVAPDQGDRNRDAAGVRPDVGPGPAQRACTCSQRPLARGGHHSARSAVRVLQLYAAGPRRARWAAAAKPMLTRTMVDGFGVH